MSGNVKIFNPVTDPVRKQLKSHEIDLIAAGYEAWLVLPIAAIKDNHAVRLKEVNAIKMELKEAIVRLTEEHRQAFEDLTKSWPPAGSGTLTDGTYGDIVVSGGGTIFTLTDDVSNQQLVISKAGVVQGTRPEVNFIEGAGMTITVTDDVVNNRVNITFASAAGGGYNYTLVNTTPYNIASTSGIHWFMFDASGGAITVNLPTAVGNTAELWCKRAAGSGNDVTYVPNGAETINGQASLIQRIDGTLDKFISDGANWHRA